jgi:phosphoglycolate phosphatase
MDPGSGVGNGIIHALQPFGYAVDREMLRSCVGPPLPVIFGETFGLKEPELHAAIRNYREYFAVKGIYEARVYDGIPTMLAKLKDAGCDLFIATSRLESSVVAMLRHYGLERFFTFVGGSVLEKGRYRKDDILRYIFAEADVAESDAKLMIGDRSYDVQAAHAVGMPCAGVSYGYGTREELDRAGADYIFRNPEEATAWLLDS